MFRGCSDTVCAQSCAPESAMQPSVDLPYLTRNVKGKQYAYTRLPDGSRPSLGRAGSPESWERFSEIQRSLSHHNDAIAPEGSQVLTQELTVAELAERYLRHRETEQQAGRLARKTFLLNRTVVLTLAESNGDLLTSQFGPRALGAIQRKLTTTPCQNHSGRHRGKTDPPVLSRSEVNRRVNGIRSIFRWGVSQELVPPTVLTALEALPGVRRGSARETPERKPVPVADVESVIKYLRRGKDQRETRHQRDISRDNAIADALEFLRWTGCRPGEACSLRIGDLRLDQVPPRAILREHKTMNSTGTPRDIPLNDASARVINAALEHRKSMSADSFVFGHESKTGFNSICANGIYQAVTRVCKQAGIPRWTPYQIRHTVASAVVAATGSELVAAALLGHSQDSTVVRRYSKDRIEQASRGADSLLL
jgi:integrase